MTLDIKSQGARKGYNFIFKTLSSKERAVNDFSAGEKEILHFIFSMYGFDIHQGLIVIDEPELHLHPQTQQKYLKIIQDSSESPLRMQCIIITHSPLFVSPENIKRIMRFYLEGKNTKCINPEIESSEIGFAKLITYTNSAQVLYSEKVILVEGPGDEYFFKMFWEWYKKEEKIEQELELIWVGGKGGASNWLEFLKKFKISGFYVGDWDNITTHNLVDRAWKTKIVDNRTNDPATGKTKKSYPDIIRLLQSDDPAKYIRLINKINGKRRQGIFILKKGELENYLGLSDKKLATLVDFCNEHFDEWIIEPSKQAYVRELKNIFEKIVSDFS